MLPRTLLGRLLAPLLCNPSKPPALHQTDSLQINASPLMYKLLSPTQHCSFKILLFKDLLRHHSPWIAALKSVIPLLFVSLIYISKAARSPSMNSRRFSPDQGSLSDSDVEPVQDEDDDALPPFPPVLLRQNAFIRWETSRVI